MYVVIVYFRGRILRCSLSKFASATKPVCDFTSFMTFFFFFDDRPKTGIEIGLFSAPPPPFLFLLFFSSFSFPPFSLFIYLFTFCIIIITTIIIIFQIQPSRVSEKKEKGVWRESKNHY